MKHFQIILVIFLVAFIGKEYVFEYLTAPVKTSANSANIFRDKIRYKPNVNNTATDCHLPFNLAAYLKTIDPNHQSEKHEQCKEDDWIFVNDRSQILFNYKFLDKMEITIKKCTYSSISWNNDDFHYKINNENIRFENGSYLNERIDFFLVSCVGSKTNAFFSLKYRSAFARINHLSPTDPGRSNQDEPINIMLFGLDSMSKTLWLKHLPKTSAFLIQELNSHVLSGFNVVGDGTPPSIIGNCFLV
jgi:hypothetical protein